MSLVRALFALLALCSAAYGQSSPGFISGATLCANSGCSTTPPVNPLGLNQAFMTKADFPLKQYVITTSGPTAAFVGNYTITGTPTPLSANGSQLETYSVANEIINIQSQIPTPDGGGFLNGRNVSCIMNSPLIIGGVQCLSATLDLQANTSPMQNNFNYVAVYGQAFARGGVNETAGVFASGFFAYAYSGANIQGLEGGEVDCATEAGVTVVNIMCWSVVALNNKRSYGTATDYAIAVGGQNGSFGFKGAFMLTGANGGFPLDSTGHGTVLGADITGEVNYGVNIASLFCNIACFNSKGFSVDGNGNATLESVSAANGLSSGNGVSIQGLLSVAGGTIADGSEAFALSGVMPAAPTTNPQLGVDWLILGNGNAAINNYAFSFTYQPGYTGPNTSATMWIVNQNSGTGTGLPGPGAGFPSGNFGVRFASTGAGAGWNYGVSGNAQNGALNIGLYGITHIANAGAFNIGVAGSSVNTGAGGIMVGGWFTLDQTTPPSVSAALIADNAAQAQPIFIARANGVTKYLIDQNGNVTAGNSTSPGVLTINGSASGVGTAGGAYLSIVNGASQIMALGTISSILGGTQPYNAAPYFYAGSSPFYFGVEMPGNFSLVINGENIPATASGVGTIEVLGGLTVTQSIYAGNEIASGVVSVAVLPACDAAHAGAHYFVNNNATALAWNGAVTPGGSNKGPIFCDGGGSWKQGANDNFEPRERTG